MAENPDSAQQIISSDLDDGGPRCVPHNKPLEVYCIDCCQSMCYGCAFQQHQGHKTQDLGSLTADLTKQETDIEKQSEDVKKKIHFFAQQIISSVQQSEQYLLGHVEAARQENLKLLSKQKEMVDVVKIGPGQPVDIPMFRPVQMPTVMFIANNTLPTLIKCQHIGDIVKKLPHPLRLPDQVIVGKKTTATVNMFAEDDYSVHPSRVSISIAPPDTSQPPVKCDFREIQSGEYEIDIVPFSRGQNTMKVTIDDNDIVGSPFLLPVMPSPESRGKPVSVISGFDNPVGVAVSSNGKIVVSEFHKHTISIWSSDEKGVNSLDILQTVKGQLKNPYGVAFTPDDHILVTSTHRLQKFSFNSHCVKSIGSDVAGPGPLQFNSPKGLAIHPLTGQVFIADSRNHRIQVLNADLSFSHCFGADGDKKIKNPYDVAFDNEGCIYIADHGNSCIKKFSSDFCYLVQFGSNGSGGGQVLTPTSVAVDTHNLVYVTDHNNHRISIFNTSGKFIRYFGKDGTGETDFNSLNGIAVDLLGNLYVSDTSNKKLLVL